MKNKLFTIVFLIACFTVDGFAFVNPECTAGNGWGFFQTAKKSENILLSDLTNDDITLGKPFSFHIALCPKSKSKPDRVTATATMPAHKHGMNYTPAVTFDDEKHLYTVEDFLFHMPGVWEISISTYQGDSVTHYTKTLEIS